MRYWKNSLNYKSGGPVFLMINGEATAEAEWSVTGQWMNYAESLGALCFLVEHRYYGNSRPVVDTSSKNMKYLSSEQALADLAYFIKGMNEKYNFDVNVKWIVFGGSYAGSLAAWMRIKYPHLVYGAVSSSGPLLAKIDFYEYFRVVKNSLKVYDEYCPLEVAAANSQLSSMVQSEAGRKMIHKLFRLCEPLDEHATDDDISNLFQNLAGNFADVVQYNNDNRKSSNITISILCDIMTGKSSFVNNSVLRYAEVNSLMLDVNNQSCLSFSYHKYIKNLRKSSWEDANKYGRQWIYQTCTEFGFYQTSSTSTDIFGDYFPSHFFTKQCAEIFGTGFTELLLDNAVKRTNIIYGALEVGVSNIIFVQGSVDPWHSLGIYKKPPNDLCQTIFMEGTAHCADMYPSRSLDLPILVKARDQIKKILKSWIKPPEPTIMLVRANSNITQNITLIFESNSGRFFVE